jgi:NAD+ kinase
MLQATMFEGTNRFPNARAVSDRYLAWNEGLLNSGPASRRRMVTSILEMEIDGQVVDQYGAMAC